MNDSDEMRKLAQMMIDNGVVIEEPKLAPEHQKKQKNDEEPLTLTDWFVFGVVCFVIITFILVFFDTGSSSSSGGTSEYSKRDKAERILKSQLNYPNSYKLWGWKVNGNAVTLEFKAKNALGMEKTEIRTIIVD